MNKVLLTLIICLTFLHSFSQEESKSKSYFLFPEFFQGEVIMKTGKKLNAKLNYNTLSEEMIFDDRGKMLAIGNVSEVDSIIIQNRKFIVLNNKFVEVLHHSTYTLYAEHKSRAIEPGKNAGYGGTSKTEAITSYSSVNIDNKVVELGAPKDMIIQPFTYYWFRKNGELYKVASMKQFMKIYKNKKDLFKIYNKQHKANFENIESIVLLISYMETN